MIIIEFHKQGKDYKKKNYDQKVQKDLKDRAISFSERGFYSFSNLVLSTFDKTRN